eukprot:TRINITY_DN7618_c0_g1_i2.p1 TRINITY_DN7618_c0_g1~~TRINITY_DN7618_c0_g1_i2.p1  ORF type:complete len:105 (+),score=18.29 TRINITY_DN7618_c0_g1_i2:916-1230(+)
MFSVLDIFILSENIKKKDFSPPWQSSHFSPYYLSRPPGFFPWAKPVLDCSAPSENNYPSKPSPALHPQPNPPSPPSLTQQHFFPPQDQHPTFPASLLVFQCDFK